MIWTHLLLYSCVVHVRFLRGTCSGLGPPEGGTVYGLLSKEALYIGKASVSPTHSPGLAARLTEHFLCLYRPGLKDAKNPGIDFSGVSYGVFVSSHWQSFPLRPQLPKHWQYRWRLRWAMRGMLRKSGGCGARERTLFPCASEKAVELASAKDGDHGRVFAKQVLSNRSWVKPAQFPGTLGLDIPFFLFSTQFKYEENMRIVVCKVLFICLIPVGWGCSWRIVRKVRIDGTSRGSGLPRWAQWEIASYLYRACTHVSEFLKLPSRQCSASKVLDYLLCFHSLPPKRVPVFQVHSVVENIRKMSTESSTMLLVACGVGLLVDGFRRSWQFAKRAARGGCGSSMARGPFGTSTPRISGTGRWSNLPMRWCCAACGPRRESGDCWCGGRLMKLTSNVSHFLDLGRSKREFHKELIHNFMEPRAVYSILFIKSGRRHRSGQSWRCRSRRQCATETFSWPTIVRSTRRGAWIGQNYSCISRRNCYMTNIPGLSGRGFRNWMFALFFSPNLFLAGYGLGSERLGTFVPACLSPLVKSKCFLDSGVRQCCKVGHSCMRRVIDCSSVPHKMAWRSVARSIRTVHALVDVGAKFLVFHS